jgi:aminotransferase
MRNKFNPSSFISKRVKSVPASGIRRFFDLAAEVDDIISLGVGEPDFITPWNIRKSCIASLEMGNTTYAPSNGIAELREEICKGHRQKHGTSYNPETNILPTVGGSEGIDLAVRSIVNPGDEVIVIQPSFVSYVPAVIFAGGVPVPVATRIENEFKIMPDDLKAAITPKTKAVIISYPNNPTGAVMDRSNLEDIADIVAEYNLIVISDEIYECLTYKGEHTCFSSLEGMKERTILLNGFSKSHAMTGFRIGYALAPSEIISCMELIHRNVLNCVPVLSQVGAIEATRNSKKEVTRMVREYDRRRRFLYRGLNKIGLDCFEPKGAFYAFPSIKSTNLTSSEFAELLLNDQRVVTIPGDAFGNAGEGFIRCAYATSMDDLDKALDRMGEFVNRL